MLNQDYTAKLLDLEDVIITNVENIASQVHIYLELPRRKHTCPICGAVTDRVHDYRMQTIKDIPLAEIPSCTFENAAIAVPVASVSLKKTHFCPVITVSPVGWYVR